MLDITTEQPGSPSPPVADRRRSWVSLFGLIVSALLVATLYRRVGGSAVWAVLRAADRPWLLVSTGAIVPITLLLALRFFLAAPPRSVSGYPEAVRLTLAATALNLFLPAKSGDLIKSYFVAKRGGVSTGVAVSIVAYERLCDLLGLIFWCMAGWIVVPPLSGGVPVSGWIFLSAVGGLCLLLVSSERSAGWILTAMHRVLPSSRLQRLRDLAAGWPGLHRELRGRRRWIVLLSIVLWLGHMTQMWLFTLAVSAPVPFATGLGLFALAVLAGQLPLTFAGFGARDVALVVLLSGHMPAASAAAIGLLSATRGIIPALAAIPILRPYLTVVAGEAARWRRK